MKYCPLCSQELAVQNIDKKERLVCSRLACHYVFWDNPIPVVGGIIETEKGVVLAHNRLWPSGIFSMVSGFLEQGETPEEGILRETWEELGLRASSASLVNVYPYPEKNQLILVYHVRAEGEVTLGNELDDYRLFSKQELADWPFGQDKLEGWPFGAGWAIRDWLSGVSTSVKKAQRG